MTSDESVEPPGSGRDAARCFAVVATLGQRDEEAAWAASRLMPAYVGVVASRKRFGQMRETLAARGATTEQLDRIANPAGLDIGAQTPEEIALSILAEITRRARRPARDAASVPAVADTGRVSAPAAANTAGNPGLAEAVTDTGRELDLAEVATDPGRGPSPAPAVTGTAHDPVPAAASLTARDPVCGMSVAATAAGHQADFGGTTYYFCCAHCREQFLAEPHKYAAAAQEG